MKRGSLWNPTKVTPFLRQVALTCVPIVGPLSGAWHYDAIELSAYLRDGSTKYFSRAFANRTSDFTTCSAPDASL